MDWTYVNKKTIRPMCIIMQISIKVHTHYTECMHSYKVHVIAHRPICKTKTRVKWNKIVRPV